MAGGLDIPRYAIFFNHKNSTAMTKKSGINKEQAYHDFTTLDGGTIRFGKEGEQIFYERRGFGRTPEKNYLITADNKIGIETNGGGGDLEIKVAKVRVTADQIKSVDEIKAVLVPGVPGKLLVPISLQGEYVQIGRQFQGGDALYLACFQPPMLNPIRWLQNYSLFERLIQPLPTNIKIVHRHDYLSDFQNGGFELLDAIGGGLGLLVTNPFEGIYSFGYIDFTILYYETDVLPIELPVGDPLQFTLVNSLAIEMQPDQSAEANFSDLFALMPSGGSGYYRYQYSINGGIFNTPPIEPENFGGSILSFDCSNVGSNTVVFRVIDGANTNIVEEQTTLVIVGDNINPCP